MGYFQPGGPGTAITVYDDNDVTGGHVAGYHTPAELFAFDPTVWTRMQSPAGLQFSTTRFQYLLALANTTIGSTAGNINLTTLELKRCDLYVPPGRLLFSVANSAIYMQLFMGTRIGTGSKMAGQDGASIHWGSQANLRCTLAMYDSYMTSLGTGQMVFNNSGSSYQEIGGSLCSWNGPAGLGTSSLGPLTIYNTTISSRTSGTNDVSGTCQMSDSDNVLLACASPRSFISSVTSQTVTKVTFSGTPTAGDIRTVGQNWTYNEVGWSDNAPRIAFLGTTLLSNSHKEWISFDVKVCDHLGNSLQAIPIQLWTDVDPYPGILSTQTGFDGNIVFTNPGTALDNGILVRDHYSSGASQPLQRDRTFTLLVNGFDGAFAPNPNYITRLIVFEWPGRDRLGSTYVTDGGSFIKVMMPINLRPGSPSRDPLWTECQIT